MEAGHVMNVTMDTISTHNVLVSIKIVFIKLVLKKQAMAMMV